MRNIFFLVVLTISISDCFSQADYILYNGKIFTSDKSKLWAQALAIKGERIMAVGKNDVVLKLKGKQTKVIDLQHRTVVPGFNDAHAHLMPVYPGRRFDVLGENPFAPTPWAQIKDSIMKIAGEISAGTLIRAYIDPDLLLDPGIRKNTLDSLAPDNPVMLTAWTGHGTIMNSAALKFFGIDAGSEFLGGRIDRDADKQPTGLLEEYANYRMAPLLAARTERSKIIDDLKNYFNAMAAFGITTTQNMCTHIPLQPAIDIFNSEQFPGRVRLMAFSLTSNKDFLYGEWNNYFHRLNSMNYVSGVKLVLDGTPIERLACMRQPYSDKPNAYGRINFDESQLNRYLRYCLDHKQQILIHSSGDSSLITIIRALRSLHPDAFWKNKRVRIEHGDFAGTHPEDLSALEQLGIIVVENPTHFNFPQLAAQRLGERLNHFQAMRSLLDHNIHFALGSDGPPNPYLNIMLATLHPNNPKEAITREEAVIAYTIGSAYAEFKEHDKGSLTRGKLADLAVLSQDIFTINTDKLPLTESIMTFVGGRIVYDNGQLQ